MSAFQNHEFGWVRFQNRFFRLLNNDDENKLKNHTVNQFDGLEHISQKKCVSKSMLESIIWFS